MKSEIHTNKKKTISRKRGRKINVFYYVRNYKIEKIYIMCYNLYKFSKSKQEVTKNSLNNERRNENGEYGNCKNERGIDSAESRSET